MAKIRTDGTNGTVVPSNTSSTKRKQKSTEEDDSSDEDDTSILNVDFEYYDPQPKTDFHGLKLLLRQLLQHDAPLFDLSALTDLILSQPLLGSTVKVPSDEEGVDTKETDPYAFLTVLSLSTHRTNDAVKTLVQYLRRRSLTVPALAGVLGGVLGGAGDVHVALLLSERFINMPSEVAPPMYRMLLEEMAWAREEGEAYAFSHYLILSKTYTEVASKLEEGEMMVEGGGEPASKRAKKSKKPQGGSGVSGETFYFHAEDEVFQRHAVGFGDFRYESEGSEEGGSDSKRAFQEMGIMPVGHMILVEAEAFERAIKHVEEYFGQAGQAG